MSLQLVLISVQNSVSADTVWKGTVGVGRSLN